MRNWPALRVTWTLWPQIVLVLLGSAWWRWSSSPAAVLGQAAVVLAVFGLALLAHEGGHVLSARRLGLVVHAVVIRGVFDAGTVRERAQSAHAEATVILAGPAASALVAAAAGAVVLLTVDPFAVARLALTINALACVGSLVLGPRSDGWRALRALASTQPVLTGEDRGMDTVTGADLDEDPGHLVADRLVRDPQAARDLDVGPARSEQTEDLRLSGCQPAEGARCRPADHHVAIQAGSHHETAAPDGVDGADHDIRFRFLGEIATRTGLDSGAGPPGIRRHGEDEGGATRQRRAQTRHQVQAVAVRQGEVDDGDIGLGRTGKRKAGLDGVGLLDSLDPGLARQQRGKAAPYDRMIVDEQDSGAASGSVHDHP